MHHTIRKTLFLCLCAVLALAFTACAGGNPIPAEAVQATAPVADTAVAEMQAVASQAEENTPPTVEDPAFPYTFTDSAGAAVTLSARPKAVAILFSSYAEIWHLAGGAVSVTVGESVDRGFAGADAVLVDPKSGHSTIDLETLVAAQPDFVVGTADYEVQAEAVAFCREQGIPAAAFRVETVEEYADVLRIFCDITGNEQAYQLNGQAVLDRISVLLGRVEEYLSSPGAHAPRVLFVRAGSSDASTKAKRSDDNFACKMLSDIGALNIADSDEGLTGTLSTEAILMDDPEYLFITTMGDEAAARDHMNALLETSGWKELSCVAGGQYAYLPKDLFHYKPNARWAEAYEYLIGMLYPEVGLD